MFCSPGTGLFGDSLKPQSSGPRAETVTSVQIYWICVLCFNKQCVLIEASCKHYRWKGRYQRRSCCNTCTFHRRELKLRTRQEAVLSSTRSDLSNMEGDTKSTCTVNRTYLPIKVAYFTLFAGEIKPQTSAPTHWLRVFRPATRALGTLDRPAVLGHKTDLSFQPE